MALPVFSVDSVEEAKKIQTLACRLTNDGRYVINSNSGFVMSTVETMNNATEYLEKMYTIIKA